eukprot:1327327-Amorphochlora_amoeboformis.AAC.2
MPACLVTDQYSFPLGASFSFESSPPPPDNTQKQWKVRLSVKMSSNSSACVPSAATKGLLICTRPPKSNCPHSSNNYPSSPQRSPPTQTKPFVSTVKPKRMVMFGYETNPILQSKDKAAIGTRNGRKGKGGKLTALQKHRRYLARLQRLRKEAKEEASKLAGERAGKKENIK